MTTTAPKPDQIWVDNDPRSNGRQVKIIAVDETHATVVTIIDALGQHHEAATARRTRIKLTRFKPTSTGYRLVEEATQ